MRAFLPQLDHILEDFFRDLEGFLLGPSLIAGLDCGLDRWTGLLDWITGSNQTASKSDDACVAH